MSTSTEYHYLKAWRLDQLRGIKRTTDPTPVRDHVRALVAAGASLHAIADAAGLSVSAIHGIHAGKRESVRVSTAKKILAISLDDTLTRPSATGFVIKVGAVRRIKALNVIGHTAADIARAADITVADVYNIVNQSGRWISRARYDAIVTAYNALSMRPGTSGHTRTLALNAGHVPPLAWDDDTIDDPEARPDTGSVLRHANGTRRRIDVVIEDVEHLLATGCGRHEITRRVGYKNQRDLARVLHRAGRSDLAGALERYSNREKKAS